MNVAPETDIHLHLLQARRDLAEMKLTTARVVLVGTIIIFGCTAAMYLLDFVLLPPQARFLGGALFFGLLVCILMSVG